MVFPKLSESFISNEIVELTKRGHEVHIFALSRPSENLLQPEVNEYSLLEKTHYLPYFFELGSKLSRCGRLLFLGKGKKRSGLRKLYCILAARHFLKTIEKLKLDVLHAHLGIESADVAMLLSEFTGVPFTFTLHARDIFMNPDVGALRQKMQKASSVITISFFNKEYLHKLTGIELGKIHVVRACMLERLKAASKKSLNNAFTILTVARLEEKKGIEYGILAISKLIRRFPEIRYNIVGSGQLEDKLKRLATSLGLNNNVRFLGTLDSYSLMKQYEEASIFLLPCVRAANGDMDGIPVSLMEAMFVGIPCVSTRISGIPELIESGISGLLVDERNVEQLAEAIERLLTDNNLRLKMGKEGKEKVETEFDIQKELSKQLRIWENVQISSRRQKTDCNYAM